MYARSLAVALTFDDGPDPRWTPEVLDALDHLDASATFFVQGERLVESPEVVREALAAGHQIQPHCWSHRSHRELSQDEIEADLERVLDALRELASVNRPTHWRPPYGHIKKPDTYEVAATHGLEIVTWTLQTCDWGGHTAEAMWKEIEEETRPSSVLKPDSVVIMHDPVGRETVKLLEKLVPEIHRRGWPIEPLARGTNTPEEAFDDCRDLRAGAPS
jgi:peptidoglycan/xylan/chitin deacetylase (PgdA/CDA1 family)